MKYLIYLKAMKNTSKTVGQVYYVDEELLESLARMTKKSEFFAASLKFYQSVKDKPVKDLSAKQKKWLLKLQQIMDDKERNRIKHNLQKKRVSKHFTWFPKKTKDGWVWLTYYTFD